MVPRYGTWKEHINEVCSIAINTKHFYSEIFLDALNSIVAYTSIVRPILEYTAKVWLPHVQINKIATKFSSLCYELFSL